MKIKININGIETSAAISHDAAKKNGAHTKWMTTPPNKKPAK